MYPQILLKNRKPDRIATLAEYRESGGYEALARVLGHAPRTRSERFSWTRSSWAAAERPFPPA